MRWLVSMVLALPLVLAGPAGAQFVRSVSSPNVVVLMPGPATCYPGAYCGVPVVPYGYGYGAFPYPPPPLYAGYWYGYGFGNHAPGVWGTEAHWNATAPHVHGYTLPGGR